jgi:hypothetical protein
MESPNQTNDVFNQQRPKTLPGMLNVLTILTFIGCGLGYINTCWGFITSLNPEKQIERIREAQEKMGDNGFFSNMMRGSENMIQKSYDYRYIILATGLLAVTLCLIGALQMRKLKKSGYYMYIVGELAPIVVMAGLFGSSFVGAISLLFKAIVAVTFVILYSTQLKYLSNK